MHDVHLWAEKCLGVQVLKLLASFVISHVEEKDVALLFERVQQISRGLRLQPLPSLPKFDFSGSADVIACILAVMARAQRHEDVTGRSRMRSN